MVIYGDSFSNALIPFLEVHFCRVSFTRFYSEKITPEKIQQNRPNVVVIEVVERYLPTLNFVFANLVLENN